MKTNHSALSVVKPVSSSFLLEVNIEVWDFIYETFCFGIIPDIVGEYTNVIHLSKRFFSKNTSTMNMCVQWLHDYLTSKA